MAINFGSYELLLAEKIKDASEIESLILSRALEKLKSGAVDVVATTSDLPTATGNENKLYYVTQDKTIYISNSGTWLSITTTSISKLFAWGLNQYGYLATGNVICYSSPVQEVSGSTNWSSVSGGYTHSTAIKADGTLWVWGINTWGQLGIDGTIHYSSPVQEVSSGTTWSSVSAGNFHTSAIKTDGTLWTWGRNIFGALGTNDLINYSSPVQEVSSSTNWSSVSSGSQLKYGTTAIKKDGTLWAWGSNSLGRLGTGDVISYSSPVQEVSNSTNWSSVSAGNFHTSAIKTDGTLWSWGRNNLGALGTDDVICYSSPVQEVSGSTNWSSVSCTDNATAAIKTDGTLWTWGNNNYGQLGTGDVVSYSSPVQEVSNSTNWSSVSAGYQQFSESYMSAIKTDGTLWSWGQNSSGRLGTNNQINYSSPVQEVSSSTNWSSVSTGGAHNLAISAITVSPRSY